MSERRALLVMSAGYGDSAQETLRVRDTAAALVADGWTVDVLAPKPSPVLAIALPEGVSVYDVARWLPRRLGAFLRAVSLIRRNRYDVVHGFDDGAATARCADRATVHRFPFVTEVHHVPEPRSAVRHAAAILVPDAGVLAGFTVPPPAARVSVMPDPHVELEPRAMTFSEFRDALRRIYRYALNRLENPRT